jgi:hypothetical protein
VHTRSPPGCRRWLYVAQSRRFLPGVSMPSAQLLPAQAPTWHVVRRRRRLPPSPHSPGGCRPSVTSHPALHIVVTRPRAARPPSTQLLLVRVPGACANSEGGASRAGGLHSVSARAWRGRPAAAATCMSHPPGVMQQDTVPGVVVVCTASQRYQGQRCQTGPAATCMGDTLVIGQHPEGCSTSTCKRITDSATSGSMPLLGSAGKSRNNSLVDILCL